MTGFDRVRSLLRGGFARSVMVVASGTAGSQVIALAATPFLTRLYGPEAFGGLGAFTAALAIVAPIAALTYPAAIVMQPDDRSAIGVARLSLLLALGIAGAIAVASLMVSPLVQSDGLPSVVATLLWLLPAALVFNAAREVGLQWLIRKQCFRVTATTAVLQAAVVNVGKALGGWLHPQALTLILVTTAGVFFHAVLLWTRIRRTHQALPVLGDPAEGRPSLAELAASNRDFPLFRAPRVLINSLAQSLPVLMLISLFGTAEAGYFTALMVLLNAPVTLLGKSVEDVFYPRIVGLFRQRKDVRGAIRRSTLVLGAIALLPFALFIASSPWLIPLGLGAEWADAASYAQWLALWTFCVLISRPSLAAIPPLGLQSTHLMLAVLSLGMRFTGLWIGATVFSSDQVSVALFAVSGVITNCVLMIIVDRRAARLRE